MTALNQNFTMFSGDTKLVIIPVTKPDKSAADLNGASAKWILQDEDGVTNVLSKQSPETIAIVNSNEIQIKLLPNDTKDLIGTFYHECEITDQAGNVSTVSTGFITIVKSAV